jgi:hypothetical protein
VLVNGERLDRCSRCRRLTRTLQLDNESGFMKAFHSTALGWLSAKRWGQGQRLPPLIDLRQVLHDHEQPRAVALVHVIELVLRQPFAEGAAGRDRRPAQGLLIFTGELVPGNSGGGCTLCLSFLHPTSSLALIGTAVLERHAA